MTDFLPYGRQTVDEADIAAVTSALADPFLTQGPRVESFERALGEYVGARHAVAFANGTAALHAAAHAAGLGPGDELLTTPLSFVASANCALFVGARPVFSDIDPETANLDVQRALDAGLAKRAKACVAVSMAGLPIDLEPLQAARRDGLVVIEDACHALGARRNGRPLGGDGLADMTTFSFHPVKAITSGEGGMVTTDDDELAEALRTFRTHGICRRDYGEDVMRGGWHYDIDSLGFNYRITDFQCALGEHQLGRLDEFIAARNRLADLYRKLLDGIAELQLPAAADPAGARHAYHLFVVRFPEGATRRRAVYDHLHASGIGVQLHYIPIPAHGLYRSLGYTMAGLDATQSYYEQALSLPIFPTMTDDDVSRVVGELRDALDAPVAVERQHA
ncbi:MAG TPA: UDP-4-amino-4,6-dideoxy-N-acetyl-beta-L-altrosamine transaminase [Solirubrobacteraceae bacterium]|nr:UDP-4-amino-4,6-dideoxy-N-acetyl-beta-L-altrosamine transaminase [Solirubrobacteraceae bacterium]